MPPESAREVFFVFLRLGLTSFGGPIAHIGYFRNEFVGRRRWLDDAAFSDLVALCQFLPGPASSQVGMALGLGRAGWPGMLAAWMGFTLPSAIAMIVFAYGVAQFQDIARSGWVHGFKVVAVAIVAQAIWGMARVLCPDRARAAVAVLAALVVTVLPSSMGQVLAIAIAGLIGHRFLDIRLPVGTHAHRYRVTRRTGAVALVLFALPFVALPLWGAATGSPMFSLLSGVYRAGGLVFGGGHVVLPLLQAAVVPGGAVSNADFIAGYGAAQAVPGPLFTFAAYLGAVAHGPLHGWTGGVVFLATIFLPAALVLVGALPYWESLQESRQARSAMAGVNAGVVGILASAFYDPVWIGAIHGKSDLALAILAFGLLTLGRVPPVLVVGFAGLFGWLAAT